MPAQSTHAVGVTAKERSQQVIDDLQSLEDTEWRYLHIIEKGKKAEDLPEDLRIEKYRVEGCASNLWLVPDFRDGKCFFRTDADAMITKGVAAVVTSVYSDATPDEIIQLDPEFLREAGLAQVLSPNRANGLSAICKQIKLYAVAFKQLGSSAAA